MSGLLRRAAARTVLAAAFLGLPAAPAHAENWVRVADAGEEGVIEIDADSIRHAADGLVYFNAQMDMGVSPSAVNCGERIFYVVGDGTLDHMNHPFPIKPGTVEAQEADFVCSRA